MFLSKALFHFSIVMNNDLVATCRGSPGCSGIVLSLKMSWNWEIRLIVLEIRPFTFFMFLKIFKCDFLKTFRSLIDCKYGAIKLLNCLSSEEAYWLKCEDWFYHFKVSHQLGISFLVAHYQPIIYWFLSTSMGPLSPRSLEVYLNLYLKSLSKSLNLFHIRSEGVIDWDDYLEEFIVLVSFKRFHASQIP